MRRLPPESNKKKVSYQHPPLSLLTAYIDTVAAAGAQSPCARSGVDFPLIRYRSFGGATPGEDEQAAPSALSEPNLRVCPTG